MKKSTTPRCFNSVQITVYVHLTIESFLTPNQATSGPVMDVLKYPETKTYEKLNYASYVFLTLVLLIRPQTM